MNRIIKEQLDLVKSVKLDFKDTDTFIKIKKQTEILNQSLSIGEVCIIEYDNLVYQVELLSKNDLYEFLGVQLIDETPVFKNQFHKMLSENSFKILKKCYYKV